MYQNNSNKVRFPLGNLKGEGGKNEPHRKGNSQIEKLGKLLNT